jgi:hypothetical protein
MNHSARFECLLLALKGPAKLPDHVQLARQTQNHLNVLIIR